MTNRFFFTNLLKSRITHFLSGYRIFTILFLYKLVVDAFIRSIVPLLKASNYAFPFRFHVLLLEAFFLLKATCGLLFRKSYREQNFFRYSMRFTNYLEFVLLFIEMFGLQEYRLHTKKRKPIIVDCGSSWGMSVLYFKHLYPMARIIAVEANKDTAAILKENVKNNNLHDIFIRIAFVSGRKGQHTFYSFKTLDGWSVSDTGALDVVRGTHVNFVETRVSSIPLSVLVRRGVDVVKLDIEGMEGEAIKSAQKELLHVTEVAIEYHPGMNRKNNRFEQISGPLKSAGMRVSVFNTKSLFPKQDALQMIYAIRD